VDLLFQDRRKEFGSLPPRDKLPPPPHSKPYNYFTRCPVDNSLPSSPSWPSLPVSLSTPRVRVHDSIIQMSSITRMFLLLQSTSNLSTRTALSPDTSPSLQLSLPALPSLNIYISISLPFPDDTFLSLLSYVLSPYRYPTIPAYPRDDLSNT